MTDLTTLRQRLAEAEEALHQLQIGSKRERISRGGTDITYTRANIGDLRRYIADLKAEVARAEGARPTRTALNPYF
ncbi:gpW protein [Pseudogulbenkiania sp. NH8B]|uniref:gpW family head-tail joining protein n=1 Tax=Pseudogulbenkiania sp. (strain NH8B) TaxID=748280 RepID=UPI0002279573|nr:gpW family head-tail joining protein [Pseudogulbenkiania sp. NH8B]BAK75398.1 gpW protein [Pseudogulbenkiania sp. NH8B]